MRWLFLIPLATGILSGYVSYYLMDEIAYFMGALSLISLLICLFIAPWELQLVILVLVLVAVRFLWLKVHGQFSPESASSNIEETTNEGNTYRTYRGIPYSPEEKEEEKQIKFPKTGTYRGLPWKSEQRSIKLLKKAKESQFVRKYRGIPISQPEEI